MNFIRVIRQIVEDNGFFRGLFMFTVLSSQKFFKYPRSYVYSYNSRKIGRKVKMKYSSDILRGFALFEIFGFCPYYSSKSGRIKFEVNENSNICDIGAFIGDS